MCFYVNATFSLACFAFYVREIVRIKTAPYDKDYRTEVCYQNLDWASLLMGHELPEYVVNFDSLNGVLTRYWYISGRRVNMIYNYCWCIIIWRTTSFAVFSSSTFLPRRNAVLVLFEWHHFDSRSEHRQTGRRSSWFRAVPEIRQRLFSTGSFLI
jgi:hypothetical protein